MPAYPTKIMLSFCSHSNFGNGVLRSCFFFLLLSIAHNTLHSQDEPYIELKQKVLDNTKFSGQWFLSYQIVDDNDAGESWNGFTLKRGYLTFTKEFNKTLAIRFTQDITLDDEGSDAGNIEMRLKYCYLKINTYRVPYFEHGHIEAGLVHRPWLDFEERINRYRVQGTMFLERHRIMNSADFGFTLVNLLGGKMDQDYRPGSLQSYPGKYGSMALGIYNGGGYHAMEYNDNKTIEGRVSLRPFPLKIPGLQFSYHMVRGKGNIPESPEFNLDHGFASFENRNLSLSAQYFQGKGNSSGLLADVKQTALATRGTSYFGEYRHLKTGLALFSRFDQYHGRDYIKSMVAGCGYYFMENSKVILHADRQETSRGRKWVYETAIELRF